MPYRPTNHPNDRRTSGYIGPTNLPTDGHQGSKGSNTSNNVPIKGVGNKIFDERIYKITLETSSEQFYCNEYD